jgi:hypothetical protein
MGQEIVYCHKCQTRLLGSDFDKGKAFKIGGQSTCGDCAKVLLASMPEVGTESERGRRSHSTTRMVAPSPDSSSKFKAANRSAAPPAPASPPSKTPLIVGLVIGGTVLLLLIAMAMSSGTSTPRTESAPPDYSRPSGVPPPGDPPRVPPPDSSSLAAELRDVDERMRDSFAKEEFRKIAEFLTVVRRRRSERDWIAAIDERIPQVEARARRSALPPLREKAIEALRRNDAAEVKRIRDQVAAWGFPALGEELAKALADPPPAPPPPPPPPVPPPPPLTTSEPPFVLYADAIAPGCRDHSWDVTVDFASRDNVFEGTRSIAVTPTKKFGGLYIGVDKRVDVTEYPLVTFALCPMEDNLNLGISVWAGDKKASTMLQLEKRGEMSAKGVWKRYVFPVSLFTPSDPKVLGFAVQAFKTTTQPLYYVDSVSFLKGAGGVEPPKPELTKELESYRGRWSQAASKAAQRDYAGAQRDLEEAAAGLKDAAAKAEAAADLDALKLAAAVGGDPAAALLKWPKYARLKAEFLNENSARAAVEGPVMQVDALRVTILRDRETIDVPLAELAAGTLAELFRARPDKKPESDARAAALFCLFEGDPEAARRHATDGIPEKYAGLPARRAESEPDMNARRLFWTAEAEFRSNRGRPAALQKYAALLAEHEKTAYVGRLKAFLASRLESGRESFLFADDMTATGTMVAGESSKVDSCWVSNADVQPQRLKENTVEFEFGAQAGVAYKAWVYAGGCCYETFSFLMQATELTMPNPKKPAETIALEPGAESALPVKLPSLNLKRTHTAHGGPKEPARWEWIPIPLPKYATAGPKKVRLLTDQQGFGVAYAVISVARALPPREPELKEFERSRYSSVTTPAPSGTILREWWLNIQGSFVEDLTKSPAFQGKPAGTDFRTIFEAPTNWADNYGQRMRGYVHPPVTGNYTFWIASDDGAELFLSTDDTPGKKRSIASQNMAGGVRDWNRQPTSKSAAFPLTAGKRYYIEILHKEGIGDDHLAVGWQLPDGTDERPIPGKRLSPYVPGGKTAGLVLYRAFNLNGPAVTIDGLNFEGKGAPNFQTSAEGFENQQVELKPPTDAARASMLRSSVWNRAGTKVALSAVPAGTYAVFLYVWEDNASETFDLFVNDRPVIGNYMSGEAGHWEKLGPWVTTVADGKIEVRADHNDANFSGLEVWKLPK